MRKTQMALAAVALVASTAAFADVTVSGRIDYAYAADDTAGGGLTGLRGGNLAPNFVNVTGSEDLGGGMKGYFNWVNLVTNGGALANANANVGITNGTAGVKLGRVTDDFLTGVLAFDVTGGGNMGSAVSPILQFGSTGAFHSNAIQLDGSVAGINFGATYIGQNTAGTSYVATALQTAAASAVLGTPAINGGDQVQNSNAGAQGDYSLKFNTVVSGIRLGAAYASRSTSATTIAGTAPAMTAKTHTFVGAGTNVGDLAVNVNYMSLNTTTVLGANASYPLSGAITATVGYYDYADTTTTANAGSLSSVGLKYAFSKATTAFANYEKVSGGAIAMRGSVDHGATANTARGIFMLGVAQSF
jgi:hypothetical protein